MFQPEDHEVPVGNPWLSVWTRPRATIRAILREDPTKHVHLLGALGGMANALDRLPQQSVSSTPAFLGAVILGGSLLGILQLYLAGALLALAGDWLGGQADAEEVRASIAWASVPMVPALAFSLLFVVVFGAGAFENPELATGPGALAIVLLGLMTFGLAIWNLVLQVVCLSEVHQFSAWRALASFFLALLVVIVPVALVVGLFSLSS